jgi:hypothetical protein
MMDAVAAERALFAEQLGCEDRLPLEFVPAGQCGVQHDESAALALLEALALLDERAPSDTDEHQALRQELNRLEAKLDLILGLMADALHGNEPAPAPVALNWSRTGVRFLTGAAPAAGDRGTLRIRPDARVPRWLELPVEVLRCEGGGSTATVWTRFEALDPALGDALERHLFARHRRRIARRRAALAPNH